MMARRWMVLTSGCALPRTGPEKVAGEEVVAAEEGVVVVVDSEGVVEEEVTNNSASGPDLTLTVDPIA